MEKEYWLQSQNPNDFLKHHGKLPSWVKTVVKKIIGNNEYLYLDLEWGNYHGDESVSNVYANTFVTKVLDDSPTNNWSFVLYYSLQDCHEINRKLQKQGMLYEFKLGSDITFSVPPIYVYIKNN